MFLLGAPTDRLYGPLGVVLATGGIAVLVYNLWRASCRVTTRASRGLLEVEWSWIIGSGKLRLGVTAIEQLAPEHPKDPRDAKGLPPSEASAKDHWSLVLRNRNGTVEVARNLPTREHALGLRRLIADRVLGPPGGRSL